MGEDNTGDFNLFQDDDGTAYIIYTAHIQGMVLHDGSIYQPYRENNLNPRYFVITDLYNV